MSERDVNHSGAQTTNDGADARIVGGVFTILETSALVLSAFTLFLLYQLEASQALANRPLDNDAWLFMPHVVLMALIVGGLRRFAAIVATFLLLAGCLFGLAACLNSIAQSQETPGMGFASVLQLPIFILCFYSARQPLSLAELAKSGPRLTLGVVFAGLGWFGATGAVAHANAPYRERAAAIVATQNREAARRDARFRVAAIAACLQRVPVTDDSQPVFPGALSGLSKSECPDAAQPAPSGFVIEYVAGAPDSAGRHRTFTLSAHDQAVSDSARAYETDESMVLTEWYGSNGRRSLMTGTNPIDKLAQVARCIEQLRDTSSSSTGTVYPASLVPAWRCSGAVGTDTSRLRVDFNSGRFVFHYAPPTAPRAHDAPAGYTLSAEPERDPHGRSTGAGLLSYLVDTAGLVHITRRARAATTEDPVIPDCPGFAERVHMRSVPICREYLPRQRWGLTSQLPTIGWSRSGAGTVGAGDTLFVIPQYQPAAPGDSIIEAHIQWDASHPDSMLPRRTGRIGDAFGNGVSMRMRHVYADTGMKQIRFWLRAGTGETYEFRDSVRVLLPRRYR